MPTSDTVSHSTITPWPLSFARTEDTTAGVRAFTDAASSQIGPSVLSWHELTRVPGLVHIAGTRAVGAVPVDRHPSPGSVAETPSAYRPRYEQGPVAPAQESSRAPRDVPNAAHGLLSREPSLADLSVSLVRDRRRRPRNVRRHRIRRREHDRTVVSSQRTPCPRGKWCPRSSVGSGPTHAS